MIRFATSNVITVSSVVFLLLSLGLTNVTAIGPAAMQVAWAELLLASAGIAGLVGVAVQLRTWLRTLLAIVGAAVGTLVLLVALESVTS